MLVDAAVATSATLSVTEPGSCGMGGSIASLQFVMTYSKRISDVFCLFYDAKTKKIKGLNGSGRAPARLSIDYLLSRGIKRCIPSTDLNAVTVPGLHILFFLFILCQKIVSAGAVAAWIDVVENFGSGRVTLADIFNPAIRLAEDG